MTPSSTERYFEDLTPCTAFPGVWRNLLAVGWLSKDHSFTKGPVEAGIIPRVRFLGPDAPRSAQVCELCNSEPVPVTSPALFVPGDGVMYVAPALLRHYVRKHGYQPPSEFLEALKKYPALDLRSDFIDAYRAEQPPEDLGRPMVLLAELEAVRRRPGMFFGSSDANGLQHALSEVVANSFDEYLAGAATRISVDIDADRWATVEDDGRGFRTELIERALTQLHSGATLDGHQPHVHVAPRLHGVGLAAVNAVSERLELETRREGVAHAAVFSRGRIIEPLHELGATSARGTRVRFLFDEEIFDDGVSFDLESIERALQSLSWLSPKLDIRFQGQSLQKTEGLKGWLRELAPNIVSSTVLTGVGNEDGVEVEVAFGWQRWGSGPLVRAFVNYGETPDEKSSNRAGLINAVRTFVRAKRASTERSALNGLVGIVHVRLLEPKFGGPTKAQLEMKGVEKAVHQVVMRAINAAPQWWSKLHEAMR